MKNFANFIGQKVAQDKSFESFTKDGLKFFSE